MYRGFALFSSGFTDVKWCKFQNKIGIEKYPMGCEYGLEDGKDDCMEKLMSQLFIEKLGIQIS